MIYVAAPFVNDARNFVRRRRLTGVTYLFSVGDVRWQKFTKEDTVYFLHNWERWQIRGTHDRVELRLALQCRGAQIKMVMR